MFELPTYITIDGTDYNITNKGDYRMVIDCFLALDDGELTDEERIVSCLIIFYEDINSAEDAYSINMQEAVDKMFNFFNCGQVESKKQNSVKLIDWEQDEQIISSAVNNVAGKELRLEPYLHWWTFMGYYMAVGESMLSTIVGIRHKIAKGKKLEKHEKDFKRDNPEYFVWKNKTRQQVEADSLLAEIWNK